MPQLRPSLRLHGRQSVMKNALDAANMRRSGDGERKSHRSRYPNCDVVYSVPTWAQTSSDRRRNGEVDDMEVRMANRERGIRFLLTFLLSCSAVPSAAQPAGTLQLTIRDQATRTLVPARVEILGSDGSYYVAEDALPVGGDCDMSDEGAGYVDLASTLAVSRIGSAIPIRIRRSSTAPVPRWSGSPSVPRP